MTPKQNKIKTSEIKGIVINISTVHCDKQNKQMKQSCTERVQVQTWLGRESNPLGIVQATKFRPYCKMLQTRNRIGK